MKYLVRRIDNLEPYVTYGDLEEAQDICNELNSIESEDGDDVYELVEI